MGIITDALQHRIHGVIELEQALFLVKQDLLSLKDTLGTCDAQNAVQLLHARIQAIKDAPDMSNALNGVNVVGDVLVVKAEYIQSLEGLASAVAFESNATTTSFEKVKTAYNARVKEQRELATKGTQSLDNAFLFLDGALGESSQESLVLTTKLSLDPLMVRFVGQYGSEQYMKHNKSLLLADRGLQLLSEIQSLDGLSELAD